MNSNRLAYFALAFICIVWGTTYVALLIGVRHFPPFLFTTFRQMTAGILLGAFMLLVRRKNLGGWANIWRQALTGFMMITIGNGFVGWAEMYVPSGIAALIASLSPLWVVLINLAVNRSEKANGLIWAGVLTGIIGMSILFRDNLILLTNPQYATGTMLILIAALGWAAGGVFIKKQKARSHPILNASLQMFFGGLGCFLLSLIFDDRSEAQWSPQMVGALVYLIIFGSLLAFAAYGYALSKLPITIVSMHAYINPLVAVLLGWLMLGEKLNLMMALAFMCIVGSLYLVNKGLKKKSNPQYQTNYRVASRFATLVRAPRSKQD